MNAKAADAKATSTRAADPRAIHHPESYTRGVDHDYFTRLRAEQPIFKLDHPSYPGGYWNLTRHADVSYVSRHYQLFSSRPHPFLESGEPDDMDDTDLEFLISLDPPDHTKMRKLVNRGFTPRRIRDLEANIQATVDGLIDKVSGRSGCDLVSDIAVELPLQVIADLVGVPPEDRHHIFELTEATFGFDQTVTPQERRQAAMDMYAYADKMCEIRRDSPQDDLISIILHAEIDGERLTQMQIDLFFMLLQNAGSETTRNLITSGMLALLNNPEQMDMLVADESRIPLAVEELLRFTTPVMQFKRIATQDTSVGGVDIAAGEPVVLWYVSANRDEQVFEDPGRLDITRDPNLHVSFGAGGPHFCLGASLARLEAKIMFRELLTRFRGLQLDGEESELRRVWSNLIDGLAEMPVRWDEVTEKVPAG